MAKYKTTCPNCKKDTLADDQWLSPEIKCPYCFQQFSIPKRTFSSNSISSTYNIKVVCEHCISEFEIENTLLGQTLECPICKQNFVAKQNSNFFSNQSCSETIENKTPLPSSQLWQLAKKIILLLSAIFISLTLWHQITKKSNQSYADKSKTFQEYTFLYPRKPYNKDNDEQLKKLTPKLIATYKKLQIKLEKSKINPHHFSNKPEEEKLFEPFCDIVFQYAAVAPHNNPIHGVSWGLCMLLDFNPDDYQKPWGKTRRYGHRPNIDYSIGENHSLQVNGEIITAFGLINSGMKILSSSKKPPKSNHAIIGVYDLITAFPPGARIKCIMPGSYADNAGLKVDDIITQVGDKSINSGSSFYKVAKTLKIGDKVDFHYIRGNSNKDRIVTIYFAD